MSYHDEKILQEIMRYQYLRVESGVAEFVVNVITPLDSGETITSEHIRSFVLKTFDGVSYEYVPKITEIIRSALKCLGFIANRKGRFNCSGDRASENSIDDPYPLCFRA